MRSHAATSYHQIEKLCIERHGETSYKEHLNEISSLETASLEVENALVKFHQDVSEFSLWSMILYWAKNTGKDRTSGARYLSLLAELLEESLFPPKKDIKLKSFIQSNYFDVVNQIRSHKTWILARREEYVSFFILLINSLSELTHGYIHRIVDKDRDVTAYRKISFDKYIELLSLLPERERLLAKIFYLGGARALEEVLSLEIKHIDFKNNTIHFPDYSVSYSQHVFEDIKNSIGSRKKGYVFIGKNSERVNHTVPYRALKIATQKLGFPSSFTFKDLTKEY